jgi:hypothetical protein
MKRRDSLFSIGGVAACAALGARIVHSEATPMIQSEVLNYYAEPSVLTAPGRHGALFAVLPDDVAALVRIVQGLCVHDIVARDFYGFTVPAERQGDIHIRRVEEVLEKLLTLDNQGLEVSRPVHKRHVGRCHHFTLLLTAILRAKRIAARARCGFGAYFNPGYFEDHWLCEYWKTDEQRWAFADAQFDEVWREKTNIRHDFLDVPGTQFLTAADAWMRCRRSGLDAAKFGFQFAGLRGLWYIAGNLVRDLAALNKVEMLPWDVWGAQPQPNAPLDDGALAYFDTIAELTLVPEATFEGLRSLYRNDERVRVPARVFNAVLQRTEEVPAGDSL